FAGTDPVKVSHVVLKTNDCEQLLCSLVQGLVLQQQLDLKVMANEEVAFSNQGNCCVYLTGYSIETDFNDYKLDDSPSSICQSVRSISANLASTYESAAWETEEEFNEKHEEDPAMAVEVPTELREEGSESDNVDTISNINEEEILPAGATRWSVPQKRKQPAVVLYQSALTAAFNVHCSVLEETVTCPEDEDVFCIAVKEEPDDDADEGPVELSNDHPEEVQEAHFPSDDTLNINTAVQVEVNEPDSVQETSVSGTEPLSPSLRGRRLEQEQDEIRGHQTASFRLESHSPSIPDGQPNCPNISSDHTSSEVSGVAPKNKLPAPHWRQRQCGQQKMVFRKASRLSSSSMSGGLTRLKSGNKVPSLQVGPASSKKHHRPPTVAEMISKVGHKKPVQVPPSHFAERMGKISEGHESRVELLGRSPRDLRLQYPSYDSSGRGNRFQCRYCSKTLNCRRSLIHHEMIHTGDKPFSCRYCQKSFIQKSQWKVHERIHTGVKPFVCKLCGKAFSRLYNKRMHAKTCKSFNTPFNIAQRETPD
ncbi:hypothetical protein BSL78_29981, partial [Apostichopus japonicus]